MIIEDLDFFSRKKNINFNGGVSKVGVGGASSRHLHRRTNNDNDNENNNNIVTPRIR